jgi:hypothetical protein
MSAAGVNAHAQLPAMAPAGPTVAAARAAVHRVSNDATRQVPTLRVQRVTRSETLMIVGGAIFLAGAIIGDDAGTIIMIGGAAVGIYGLYLYLQ